MDFRLTSGRHGGIGWYGNWVYAYVGEHVEIECLVNDDEGDEDRVDDDAFVEGRGRDCAGWCAGNSA